MQYAVLGRTGLKVSRLGFGCMRLPMKTEDEVDREKAIPMLQRAHELGVNYFDTAIGYCRGDSQRVLGEAFEGMRHEVILSTKNHFYDKTDRDKWWRRLEDSLKNLRTDYIDVYKFHGMSRQRFAQVVGEDGLYREMLKAREQGLIRHISTSFHDSCDFLKELVDTGWFESILLQYNLINRDLEDGIAYARQKGVAIEVMGPVWGGRLGFPSDRVKDLVGDAMSTPDLALRFVLANEGVVVAFSGMSTMQQLEENVETAGRAGALKEEDHRRMAQAVEERKKLLGLYCTGCNYCMPCAHGVDIPANFEALNLDRVFGLGELARTRYAALAGKAARCRLCGKCIEPCPQGLDIPRRLSEALSVLDERAGAVGGWNALHGALLVEEGTVEVECRYHLKNFTDQTHSVEVEFLPHRENQVRPLSLAIEELGPYALKDKRVRVTIPRCAESLNVDVRIRWDDRERLEHVQHIVHVARRSDSYALNVAERRAGCVHVPPPLHPIHASDPTRTEDPVKGHSFDFSVAYDDANLYVYADVEDDLAGPPVKLPAGEKRMDRFVIFLDGRRPASIGLGGYEEGVMRVAVHPPIEDADQAAAIVSNDAEVEVDWAPVAGGYRLDCAIPWRAFCKGDVPPRVLGFDVAMLSHNEEGRQVLYLNWTGNINGMQDTSAFGSLLLV